MQQYTSMSNETTALALRQALAQLSPLDRNLLCLRYVHGLNLETLGGVLGVHPEDARCRIASARRRTLLHARLANAERGIVTRMGDLTHVLRDYPLPDQAMEPPSRDCRLNG